MVTKADTEQAGSGGSGPGSDDLAHLPLARQPVQERARLKVLLALQAAESLSVNEGPAAVNLNRVAADAGLSVGALYQYLPSGEAIVAALMVRHHQRLEAVMDELVERHEGDDGAGRGDEPAVVAEAVLDAVAAVFEQGRGLRDLADAAGPGLHDVRVEHKRRMRTKVARMLTAGGVAADRADTAAAIVFAACDAALHDADHDDRELRRFLHVYLDDLVRAGG